MTVSTIILQPALDRIAADVDHQFDILLPLPDDPRRRLYEAMRHATIGGGKRLRPLLVVAACHLFNVDEAAALRVATAIECIHVYSLIHDDLPCMDDDDLRRGKPTVHKAFDEATAVLAGDSLHALAFELVADETTHGDPFVRAELTLELARASGAFAHERVDADRRGKGYALQWLMQQLWASAEPHNAVLILDADSIVSPNFLTVMDARLARGERAICAIAQLDCGLVSKTGFGRLVAPIVGVCCCVVVIVGD